MSISAVRQALEIPLFAMTPALPVAWENQAYLPQAGVAFVRSVLMPAEPENPTLGDGYHRLNGIFYLEFHYPKNTGSAAAASRAELTKTTFKRGNSFTNSGVKVVINKTPEIGQGSVVGEFWVLPWRCRWFAEVFA